MRLRYIILPIIALLLPLAPLQAVVTATSDSLYTPYKLNYLPAGSPLWMARLATPHGLDYKAMVDSFEIYLKKTPGARYKSRDTKQVVNHFRRFQQAYLRFVQPDGIIRLPLAESYHRDVKSAANEARMQRAARTRGGTVEGEKWEVISPIVTYDYLHKKVSPAQANIQRFKASRSHPEILYCGSETGMIFRTTDKGETWHPCNYGEWMAGEITTVDISSTNPNRVLVGAGGVFWISNDGGDTWDNITPENAKYARTASAQFHPVDDNVILAGDRARLWRSTDGGASWQLKLEGTVFDVKFSVQNPDVCYVAIGQDNTVNLYKSADGGASWSLLTLGDQPLISARIGLSEAPTGADYVYLWACRNDAYSQPGPLYFSGSPLLYKSTDGGASFTVTDPVSQLEPYDKYGGQGYYDLVCTASATDPEVLLVGIIQLYRSADGGKTFENIGGYYGRFDLHCDMQCVQTNGTGDTWLSTDGGMIYSNDFFLSDAQPKLHGLYASEMWGFDQGWNEDVMVGGRNHNGNMSQLDRYNGVTLSMRGSERPTGYVFLSNPRKVAFSDSENVIMPDNWQDEFVPFLDFWTYPKESSQHGIGLEFDPRYAQCFYIVQGTSDNEHKTLWRTRDDGASFSTVYTFDKPINAVALSRSNPDKIVVSTWGRIFYSLNAGETFEEYPIPDEMTYSINYKIAIHPTNEDEIWVSDGNAAGFWRTVDNGVTWEKLDAGLTFSNWEGNIERHQVGRFFLTGNEKNAAYAIAFTMGYLNESYTTPRGRVLYRDDTTDGWVDFSEGLPKVINLNRMLPFYKEGVIRLATNNGIWQRPLVDSSFTPIAQPLILNAGSGDNTQSDYPRTIQLDSYSIVNQNDAEWKWNIVPAPLSITADDVRNPVITIAPDQTYDITLTVTTPAGSDTKRVEAMIKGNKQVPVTGVADVPSMGKELLLTSGNVVTAGESFVFEARELAGKVELVVYDAGGAIMHKASGNDRIEVPTVGYPSGVYFFMAVDGAGYRKTGKLLVK
ncbi:MAG: hypothetical protein IJZ22_03680 [Bacteroidaceae bacterium]|nr:hypothetical protein [Bacteroidaceae bacterium]